MIASHEARHSEATSERRKGKRGRVMQLVQATTDSGRAAIAQARRPPAITDLVEISNVELQTRLECTLSSLLLTGDKDASVC